MNGNGFRRLLLSYLPAFFIVVTILFVVFFQALNEQNRREAIKANEFLAEQVIRYVDSTLKSVDYRILRDILSSPVVKDFYGANSENVYSSIQAIKLMDEWKVNYPLIDSVYLYRLHDRYIAGDGSGLTSDFYDEPFLKPYLDGGTPTGKWTGRRTYRPYPSEDPEEVITLVRDYPHFSSVKSGYVIVNVSLGKLKRSLSPMYNANLTYVGMKDGQGNGLLSEEGQGAGDGSVFSRYVSPYTGWEVTSGPANRGLSGLALDFYNYWMIMAIVAVALGAAWVIQVTRRNYKPISQLVSLIRASSLIKLEPDAPKANEFGFIRGALESLMEETKQTREQNREAIILHKKYRFQEALEGNGRLPEDQWRADLAAYKVNPAGPHAFVWIAEIDRYDHFVHTYNTQDQSILKFVLSSVLQELAQQHEAAVWAEWTTDRRLTAVVWPNTSERTDLVRAALGRQAAEWVRGNLSFTVTIAVHGQAANLEELRNARDIAANLLQYKAVLGANRVILADQVEGQPSRVHEFFGTIHSLTQAIRLSDKDWHRYLDDWFGQIRGAVSTRKEIESLIQFMHQQLGRIFLELSRDYRDIWKEAEAELTALERSWETVEELKQAYPRLFERLLAGVQNVRESQRSRSVIAEIRAHLEEEYANPDISLDYLSAKFTIHAKNISKLFKEEFGENFVDYLIRLRMNRAKQLLLESDKSLQQISAEAGYYNYNSFNRAFKNAAGISPSEYRKYAGQGQG